MFHRDEPLPVVGVAPGAAPTVCIEINVQWVPILVGLAEFMLWSGFWAGTEEEVKQAVSHAVELVGLVVGVEGGAVRVCTIVEVKDGSGGASVVGLQTRILNTIEGDTDLAEIEVGNLRFTPIAGTYLVWISAPAHRVGRHRCWLSSLDGPGTVLKGQNAYTGQTELVHTHALCAGRFVCNGSQRFEVKHWTQLAKGTNGLGMNRHDGYLDRYTQVTLMRIG